MADSSRTTARTSRQKLDKTNNEASGHDDIDERAYTPPRKPKISEKRKSTSRSTTPSTRGIKRLKSIDVASQKAAETEAPLHDRDMTGSPAPINTNSTTREQSLATDAHQGSDLGSEKDIEDMPSSTRAAESKKKAAPARSRKRPVAAKRPRKAPVQRKAENRNKDDTDDDFDNQPASQRRATATAKSNATKRNRNRYSKKWDPRLVITDCKSPIVNANLNEMLKSEKAWDLLTPDQQRELLTFLPRATSQVTRTLEEEMIAATPAGQPLPNIALQRLQESMAFKSDIRQFQEELEAGKLDIAWTEQAMMASQRRKRGDFDDWKVREREDYWEMTDVKDG